MKKSFKFIIFLLFIQIIFGFEQASKLEASIKRGKDLYQVNCQSCHMISGEGIPGVFPPLKNSTRVSDKNRMIEVVLNGMKGPVVINNQKYNGEMAAFDMFSDQEVSDVLNFIRNSFGNKNESIEPKEVRDIINKAAN